MGQIVKPSSGGISVAPIDREAGPGAGPGATGNRCIFLGAGAGTNSPLSDNIVLGNAAENGNAASTAGDGTIVIGSQAVQAANVIYDRSGSDPAAIGPAIVIGFNAAQNCNMLPNTLIVGSNALAGMVNNVGNDSIWNNTILGCDAVSQPTSNGNVFNDNVFIGSRAGRGLAATIINWSNNTFIGSRVVNGLGNAGASSISDNVVIGYNAAPFMGTSGNPSNNVLIGSSAGGVGMRGSRNCVVIGQGTSMNNSADSCVLVGASTYAGGQDCTIIGAQNSTAVQPTGYGWILLGRGAGVNEDPTNDNIVLIETNTFGTKRTILYSRGGGNVTLGNSTASVDREASTGTNNIKIVNGTIAGANPVGGGYFYVSAGALHWVGSAGTDTTVAPA